MAGFRKPPRLRIRKVNGSAYYTTDIWTPEGRRTSINFGSVQTRNAADVYEDFGKWLRLFQSNPHKTLAFASPQEAIAKSTDHGTIVTVKDLADQYVRWANDNFRLTRSGDINPNYKRITLGIKFLEPYAKWPVSKFGPDELRAVQKALMVHRHHRTQKCPDGRGLSRSNLNDTLDQLRRMFVWALGRSVIQPAQEQSLHEVRPLRYGTPGVRETVRRRPVTDEELKKVLAAANPEIADMVRVMWRVLIRPDEVCGMRPCDFLKDDPSCWLYVPGRDRIPLGDHKETSAGKLRAIPITKAVQTLLRPRIAACPSKEGYLFSPAKAVRHLMDKRLAARTTPILEGNRVGTNRSAHPMIAPGERYTSQVFCVALKRACRRAGVEMFTPYDLRRTVATRVDAVLGREAARRLLGHAHANTTNLYMLEEVKNAVRAAQDFEKLQGRQVP